MNNFFTRLSMMLFCITCLASCTVYKDPVSYSYVDINTGVKVGRDLDISVGQPNVPSGSKITADNLSKLKNAMNDDEQTDVVKPVAAAASVQKVEMCARLIPPKHGPLPRLTEAQMEEMAKLSPDRFNSALLTMMKKMYQYSKIEQAQDAEAYRKHVATCRMVVVQ